MKNSPSISAAAKKVESPAPGFFQRWTYSWFSPVDPVGLHTVRFLAGVVFTYWLLMLAGNPTSFFGLGGWVDRETASRLTRAFYDAEGRDLEAAANLPESYRAGWSVLYLLGSNPTWVHIAYWASILVFILFALGLWTRITSVLTWVMVASFIGNPVTRLDAEPLLGMLAFYLMIGYLLLGQWSRQLSRREQVLGSSQTWLFGRGEQPPSIAANLAMRLIQVHFALVVVVSALHKLQSGDWWSGVAFWYPLHPPFQTTRESLQVEAAHAPSTLFFLSLGQYLVLAWQLGFPFFAWRRGWRPVLLGGAVIGWIGCLAIYKQPLFGPIYCIGVLSFLTPTEWLAICDKLKLAVDWSLGRKSMPSPTPVKQGIKA